MRERTNLVETLLQFADRSRPAEEDPITEILAWLLRRDFDLRRVFAAVLNHVSGHRLEPLATRKFDAVTTQVVVPRAREGSGVCRYDLVLDDHSDGLRIVVEVKVGAELTLSGADAPTGGSITPARTQVDDYLDIAMSYRTARQLVFVLAPGWLDVGTRACTHPCFGGHVRWQAVHDAFAIEVRRRGANLDSGARVILEQFIASMEARKMAATRLTFDGAVSVRRYMRFEQAITSIFTDIWNKLHGDHTLDGFQKINSRAWQNEHDRLGYRLWTSRDSTSYFGFIGLWCGEETMIDDVPDLFLSRGAAQLGRCKADRCPSRRYCGGH